ncbi:unnamed protein product [Cylindrotheca closterium]|uniref:Uncharacterized protein n=1 Tax=Cylindrotheca closterium TaxID=2856 RepID=A0AAD2FXK8_9STRA|nr:unnamed protein product [Cylindrotheca closterium]
MNKAKFHSNISIHYWKLLRYLFVALLAPNVTRAWRHSTSAKSSAKDNLRNTPSIGPLPFLLSPQSNFRWKASIDPKTGIASSEETSKFQWKQNYETSPESMRSVIRVSRQFISHYPQWLARPKVSFGLLTTKTDSKSNETTLRPRFLPNLPLLTFGPMQVIGSPKKPWCQYKLPITGGLLALGNAKRPKDMGCLFFETNTSRANLPDKDSWPELACTCTSEIAGAYRPWIAGGPSANFIRPWAYLSSQSMVHAYVMWRFHKAWKRRLTVIS